MNFPVDPFFHFGGEALEVFHADPFTHQYQFNVFAVVAHGHGAGEVSMGDVSDAVEEFFHEVIEAHVFAEDDGEVGKKGVVFVGTEYLAVLLHAGKKQPALLKAVEFDPDGVGAFAKFIGQPAEMAGDLGGEEELQEKLEAGFTGDDEVEQAKKRFEVRGLRFKVRGWGFKVRGSRFEVGVRGTLNLEL